MMKTALMKKLMMNLIEMRMFKLMDMYHPSIFSTKFWRMSKGYMSHLDSWSDPIGGFEPSLGRETIYWDFFFYIQNQNIIYISKELPLEWCPSKSIYIYRVPFTYTKTIFLHLQIRAWNIL